MTFVLDFRSARRGGAVTAGILSVLGGVSGEAAVDRLRLADRVYFLTHGFNVDRRDGRAELANLATFLRAPAGTAVVAVLWPGDSVIPVVSYPFEGRTADDSAKALARFITQRNALRPGTPISFVTHSLGARVGMETFKRLLGKNYPLSQVCLMAPAVVDYALCIAADYRAASEACQRVVVLSSRSDRVLQVAFPLGNFFEVFPLFRRETVGRALGFLGPRARDGAAIPKTVCSEKIDPDDDVGHFDYMPDIRSDQRGAGLDADQRKRVRACDFAACVLRGDPVLRY